MKKDQITNSDRWCAIHHLVRLQAFVEAHGVNKIADFDRSTLKLLDQVTEKVLTNLSKRGEEGEEYWSLSKTAHELGDFYKKLETGSVSKEKFDAFLEDFICKYFEICEEDKSDPCCEVTPNKSFKDVFIDLSMQPGESTTTQGPLKFAIEKLQGVGGISYSTYLNYRDRYFLQNGVGVGPRNEIKRFLEETMYFTPTQIQSLINSIPDFGDDS